MNIFSFELVTGMIFLREICHIIYPDRVDLKLSDIQRGLISQRKSASSFMNLSTLSDIANMQKM